ncbi:MAG: TonB family protein, partial [Acidobacteriota bacterium]|nr:TonB family protein [Acidobacteriota bacterium]
MSTHTLQQGSLRFAKIPAITVVHPGLQVHSIAAPKPDRRLSFLVSANIYCALAAGAVLAAHAAPGILKPLITTGPPPVVVELGPPEAVPNVAPPMAPARGDNLSVDAGSTPTLTEPETFLDTLDLPTTFGTDRSQTIAGASSSLRGTGRDLGVGTLPPGTFTGPGKDLPVEVSFNSVGILQQVQPAYPSLARLAHKQGDVVLIMTINEQGTPIDVRMDSGDAIFRADAIRAAQQWRFT